MYLLGQTAHTIGNLWLSHWSDENAENPEVALNQVIKTNLYIYKRFRHYRFYQYTCNNKFSVPFDLFVFSRLPCTWVYMGV